MTGRFAPFAAIGERRARVFSYLEQASAAPRDIRRRARNVKAVSWSRHQPLEGRSY